MRRALVWMATTGAMLLAARPALANDPATAPPTATPTPVEGRLLVFEKPHLWEGAVSETWVLRDRYGRRICELPCAARVEPSSDDVLEGVAVIETFSTPSGSRVVENRTSANAYYRLPDVVGDPSEGSLRVRITPGRGNADGAIALGVLSGVIGAVAGCLFIAAAVTQSQCKGFADGCAGPGEEEEFLFIPLTLAAVGGVGALVWGLASERPKLVLSPLDSSPPPPPEASRVRVRFSGAGLVGTF